MKKILYILGLLCTLFSCAESVDESLLSKNGNVVTRSLTFGISGEIKDWESSTNGRILNGYVVLNNLLIGRHLDLKPDAANQLNIDTPEGSRIYFTLGNIEPESLSKLVVNSSTEAELLSALVSGSDNEQYFYSTQPVTQSGQVDFIRTVGRLDLELSSDGATKVEGLEFEGLAQSAPLFTGKTVAAPERYNDRTEFASPLTSSTSGVRYLYESSKPIKVTVYGSYDNKPITVSAEIPAILRNKIYTLRVNDTGASLSLSFSVRDWELGETVESSPDINHPLNLNQTHSVFPANAMPDYTTNSVSVTASGATLKLAFLSDTQVDVVGLSAVGSPLVIGTSEVKFADRKVCTIIPVTVPVQSHGSKPYEVDIRIKSALSEGPVTDSIKIRVDGLADKLYTVAFNANGGQGSMSPQTAKYNEQAKLNANQFARTGYTFGGWNTEADGTGTAYTNQAEFMNLTDVENATVTLYAQWRANRYQVVFMPNGGQGTMATMDLSYGESTSLTANGFSRNGYQFKNWSSSPNGSGTVYENGSRVMNLTSVAGAMVYLYAQWESTTPEQPTTIVYVTPTGAGAKTGASWENAMPGSQLQTALNMGIPEVRLALGSYTNASASGMSTFVISNSVHLTGGWNSSTGTRSLSSKSVLNGANGKRVMQISASNVWVDNVVITGGYPSADENGGGILIDGTGIQVNHSMIVANRTFSASGGGGHGAGINVTADSRNVVINNSLIAHNEILNSIGQGGGVNAMAATSTNSTTLNFCTVVNNKISASTNNSLGTKNSNLNSCVIWNNTSSTTSSSMYEIYFGKATNCAFNQGITSSNTAQVKITNDNSVVQFVSPSMVAGYNANWSSFSYKLQSTSAIAHTGAPVSGITTDIIGNERPSSSPSIGAYQLK